ncbi:RidA family protein [Arenibacter troitsensis]|uniref:Enamine deaminase RidA, house cleaning of reactive enamine intermediates, YjgF/YER057c/UK114 family n=1 Tax=Arenibacter troitsensis TaxID=188872 RepID=A0A1X7L7S4_9FLAO|nr:RidA family protein [Arenibacter troitsensis]SMG49810.1 Enamine deaminase RidA, house cleaning of reactive enamine intermediates, YjgF/YER057c/UK114 family [Arenibacter troitsensis]
MENKTTTRRASFKKLGMGLAAIFGIGTAARAMEGGSKPKKEVVGDIVMDQDIPLFSGGVKHGNTLYIAGKGAHVEPFEIKAHTEIVLQELEKELKKHGSSMDKVLKVNVYLADLADYKGMNEVFRGRFGPNPPVRTTVATYGGVPGNSLVEMDCIAALD